MKETPDTNKVGFVLSKNVPLTSTVSVNPNNQNKSQSFLWVGQRAPKETYNSSINIKEDQNKISLWYQSPDS